MESIIKDEMTVYLEKKGFYDNCQHGFWLTVLSVVPLLQCVVCCLSVTFCIVAKRYVLAKNFLKK